MKEDDFKDSVARAIQCVDEFTQFFNARDLKGMDSRLHFPHIILMDETLIVWEEPGQLTQCYFDDLVKETGWFRSNYLSKTPVLASRNKVCLSVEYTRECKDGAIISRHSNLWIVTFEGAAWGVKIRSY